MEEASAVHRRIVVKILVATQSTIGYTTFFLLLDGDGLPTFFLKVIPIEWWARCLMLSNGWWDGEC